MRFNLLIMVYLWVATSVSYYITNFNVKYLKGILFYNTSMLAISECLSLLMAGYIYLKLGPKISIFLAFMIGLAGCVLMIIFEDFGSIMPLLVLLTRFGIGSVFGMIYVANLIFPVQYASQTLGLCNLMARTFTIMSPVIAEWEPPTPMLVFCLLDTTAGLLSTRL